MTAPDEHIVWKRIDEFDDSYISNLGHVLRKGKPKKSIIAKNGYMVVTFSVNNRSHTRYIHRLLALAFIGKPKVGQEILHINGNRTDNRLSNLRWGTRKENVADAIRHGTATIGVNNGGAKLRETDIPIIKDLQSLGFYGREIAKHFDVSQQTIYRVVSGITYKGVTQ